jgi:DNA-binding transcriptional regulator YhcF (GntR family)
MQLTGMRLDSRAPAYRQIADALRATLVEGGLAPGARLPPVRELALDLGVHFNTVAQAYRVLALEGWLTLKRRRGAVVLPRKQPAPDPDRVAVFARRLGEMLAQWRAEGIPPAAIARELRAALDGLRK